MQVAHVVFRSVHGIMNAAIGLVNQLQETAAAINLTLPMTELATDIQAIRGLTIAPELGFAGGERARKVIDEP